MVPQDRTRPTPGYEQFFGFKERPFSLAPDPRFLFASASHSAALAQVAYAIDRREPIVVVTGEIGTGKTLLCRTVLQRLPRKTFVSVIDDPLLGADDLLKQLLHDFGVISRDRAQVTDAGRHDLVQALHAFLRSLASLHAHAVVIVDEAQHVQPAVLEQVRLLSNIEDENGTLLQIVLVGQRDIEPLLSRPELRQLEQRVVRRFRLEPLSRDEVQKYIEHRLERAQHGVASSRAPGAIELARALAEWEGDRPSVEFRPDAVEAIARVTGGVPRLINLLCDRTLEAAFDTRVRVVDRPLVDATARVIGLGDATAADGEDVAPADDAAALTRRRPSRWLAVAALVAIAAGGAIWLGVQSRAIRSAAPVEAPSAPAVVRHEGAHPPLAPPAAPSPAPAAPVPAAPAPTPATPPAAVTPVGGDAYEIVVASFHTESRAASVEAQVTSLGVPARRRVQGTWQQVIGGPFASRDEAEAARQKLDRAGLTGAQIVAATR